MEDLVLDADTLFGIADVVDGYCAKQREVINVYYAQIMALESEWRDDETFGSLVEELNSLKTQALALIEEIYETYPKYFRKRAQQILERPIYRNETVIPAPIFTNIPNKRVVGYTGSGIRGSFNGSSSHLAQAASDNVKGSISKVSGYEATIDSPNAESFLWFKGGKTDKSKRNSEKKYITKFSKDIVEQNEYKNFHKYYDLLDTLDIPQSFKEQVIKCYQSMDEALKAKYNSYAKSVNS